MIEGDDDGPWTVWTLRKFVETRFLYERDLTDEKFIARDKASELAYVKYIKHVEDIDVIAERVQDMMLKYFTRTEHDAFAAQLIRDVEKTREALSLRVEETRERLADASRPNYVLWATALGLLLSMTSSLWYLSTKPIEADISRLKDQDTTITEIMKSDKESLMEQNKLLNGRIDRLYELYRDLQSQHVDMRNSLPQTKKPQ